MFRVIGIEETFWRFHGQNLRRNRKMLDDRPEDDQLVEAVRLLAQSGATALELVQLIHQGLSRDDTKSMDEKLAMRLIYEVSFNTGSDCEVQPEEFAEELIEGADSLWLMASAGFAYACSNHKPVQHVCVNQYLAEFAENRKPPPRLLAVMSVSGIDGHRIPKSISLNPKKHVRVGSCMWRVRIENGEVFSSKRNLVKWVFKNWGNIKTQVPLIGEVDPFCSDLFHWKWSEHEIRNPEEVYEIAMSEGENFTKWYVLQAVAGNITAKQHALKDKMWWFKKKADDGFDIGDIQGLSLNTMAKSGALMTIGYHAGSEYGSIPSNVELELAFTLNVHGRYTTISKVTDSEIQYKANFGTADPNHYNILLIDETGLPSDFRQIESQ